MRFYASLFSIVLVCLAGCGQEDLADYGFSIRNVSVSSAYQSLNIRLEQELTISEQAREALEHGVMLVLALDLELRNDNKMIVAQRTTRHFQLRYLPLSERYQLAEEDTADSRSFSRLRHLFAALSDLNFNLPTGPLPSGSYELRTRIRLDESRLPAPMRLPVWFSAHWQHDSEWSVWPFKVSA